MNDSVDPFDIVRRGYDKVSEAYRSDDFEFEGTGYQEIVSEFTSRLDPSSRVLDLGCGCGIPVSQVLSADYDVLGVDFSPVQIQRARALVPDAVFLCEDMTALRFQEDSFDGIISLFAIIHVPVGEQLSLFAEIAKWLRPDGVLAVTVGHTAWTGTEANWRDVPGGTMYWSHAEADTYVQWIEALELEVEWDWFIPEGDGGHSVFIATKRGSE